MRQPLCIVVICFAVLACDNSADINIRPDSITGFWSREMVYLNGVNSVEYVDFLNGGTNFLEIKNDHTFSRAYDNGTWHLSNVVIKLERGGASLDWTYKIIEYSKENLILEIKLTEGQYCCGFDAFSENEIITIKEVYKKVD